MNAKSFKSWLYIAIVILVVYYANKMLKSVFAFFGEENSDKQKEKDKEALYRIDKEIKYDYLSHNKSYYYTLASQIYSAIQDGYFNEDEESVYQVMKHLWNNSDVLMLKKAWGTRPIGYTGLRTNMTLDRALRYWLSTDEMNKINYILKHQKGGYITLRF